MIRDDVVKRARSMIGKRTVYVLGAGGRRPASDTCTSRVVNLGGLVDGCDCSGFVAWDWSIDRFLDPGWFETTAIFNGAETPGGFHTKHGDVTRVPWAAALPGDALVYGDHDGHQGHIGLVTEVTEHGPTMVCHCSLGAYHRTADAIQETDCAVFINGKAIVVAASWVSTAARA